MTTPDTTGSPVPKERVREVLYFFIFSLMLCKIHFFWGFFVSSGILSLRILPAHSSAILAIYNFIALYSISINFDFSPRVELLYGGIATFCCILFYWLYSKVTKHWGRPITIFLLLVLSTLVASFYPSWTSLPKIFSRLIVQCAIYQCFYLLFITRTVPTTPKNTLLYSVPFFTFFHLAPIIPVFLSHQELISRKKGTEIFRTQRSALLLLLLAVLCHELPTILKPLSQHFPLIKALLRPLVLSDSGFWANQALLSSPGKQWLVLCFTFFTTLAKIIEIIGPPVASLRMLGITVESPVTDFWNSHSLGQWFQKINIHYSKMVQYFFIGLILRTNVLRRWPNFKVIAATFFGVSAAGIWSHHIFYCLNCINCSHSVTPPTDRIWGVIIYWPLVSFFICLMHFIRMPHPKSDTWYRILFFRRTINFITWVSLLVFVVEAWSVPSVSLETRLQFFYHLFGL